MLNQPTFVRTCCQTIRAVALYSTDRPTAPRDYFEKDKAKGEQLEEERLANVPFFLKAFASLNRKSMNLYRYDPTKFSMERYRAWKEKTSLEADLLSQAFSKQRHAILGSDLATAHFIVHRGGKVKFVGHDRWIGLKDDEKQCEELPKRYDRNYYLEAVDASDTEIRYEGLLNFVKLNKLKCLIFKNCINVDDWFVDRLSGEFGETLEHLDLSGCQKLTENVFSCMYRFKKLKTLLLDNVNASKQPIFKLSCLLLEDSIPDLTISGVDYYSQKLNQ